MAAAVVLPDKAAVMTVPDSVIDSFVEWGCRLTGVSPATRYLGDVRTAPRMLVTSPNLIPSYLMGVLDEYELGS